MTTSTTLRRKQLRDDRTKRFRKGFSVKVITTDKGEYEYMKMVARTRGRTWDGKTGLSSEGQAFFMAWIGDDLYTVTYEDPRFLAILAKYRN